jgi:hypothetical protein
MADERDDPVDEQHVGHALARRKATTDSATRGALVRLATGILRQLHVGASDPIMDPLKKLLGVDEREQIAQTVTDWYLEGRRDSPPFAGRPVWRPALADVFRKEPRLAREPTDLELDVLVDALVGVERDRVLAPSPMARMVIASKLVDAWARGE